MNYCGIDLAGVSSYVYVTDDKGRKLWSGPADTSQGDFRAAGEKVPPRRVVDRH